MFLFGVFGAHFSVMVKFPRPLAPQVGGVTQTRGKNRASQNRRRKREQIATIHRNHRLQMAIQLLQQTVAVSHDPNRWHEFRMAFQAMAGDFLTCGNGPIEYPAAIAIRKKGRPRTGEQPAVAPAIAPALIEAVVVATIKLAKPLPYSFTTPLELDAEYF